MSSAYLGTSSVSENSDVTILLGASCKDSHLWHFASDCAIRDRHEPVAASAVHVSVATAKTASSAAILPTATPTDHSGQTGVPRPRAAARSSKAPAKATSATPCPALFLKIVMSASPLRAV